MLRTFAMVLIAFVCLGAAPARAAVDLTLQGTVGGSWPTSGTSGPILRYGASFGVGYAWDGNALGGRFRLDTDSGIVSGLGKPLASLSLYYRRTFLGYGPQQLFATAGLGVTSLIAVHGDVGEPAWAPTLFGELGTAVVVAGTFHVIGGVELTYVSTIPYGNVGMIGPGLFAGFAY